MDQNKYPAGWDAKRVQKIIAHYDAQTQDEEAQEIEDAIGQDKECEDVET